MDEDSATLAEGSPKHLKADRRRQQFDTKTVYGRVGATRRTANRPERRVDLETIRPRDKNCRILATEVDAEWELQLSEPNCGLTREQILELERFLARKYVARTEIDNTGRKVVHFQVPGTGWVEGADTAKELQRRLD